MKKLLVLFIALTLITSILPSASYAAEAVSFYSSETHKELETFGTESSVYAKLSFTAPKSGKASIIAAHYSESGAFLKTSLINTVDMVEGNTVDFTSTDISVSGTETLKIFAWDGLDTMVPVLSEPGVIEKTSDDSGFEGEEDILLYTNSATATVPGNASLETTADALSLSVESLDESASGIETNENEVLTAVDVHIDGVSEDNEVPILVTVDGITQNGLNKGNLSVYHVEGNETIEMTEVSSADELTAHNQFYYDAESGSLTLSMASFSEVAVVADTENAWNGTVATIFSSGTGTEADPYIIANADQLAYLGDRISNDNKNYGSAHYKLNADINMGGEETVDDKGKLKFYPIGYTSDGYQGAFEGVFDGNGHKISNIYQNTWLLVGNYSGTYYNAAMGLFGYVYGGTVKNLTIDNFKSEGEFAPTGCITAYAGGECMFENIAITNSHPQTYNTGVAGIVGWDNGGDESDLSDQSTFTFKNITIDNTNTISALWGSWDVAAAGLLGYLGEYSKAELENCHVAATIDVYNDVCGNYQYYWYRYCGMMIGTVDKTKEDGSLDLSNITATNCTVAFGDRHEYYYCEFVKNSIASYTHDYQFSRVKHDELNYTDSNSDNKINTNEAESVTGCKHDHAASGTETIDGNNVLVEDKQAVYLPFRQLFGGYGWGVDGVDQEQYPNIQISEIQESVTKFSPVKETVEYETGTTVTIGEIFTAEDNVDIDTDNVQVFVSPVGDDSTASGEYTANTTDWTKGTLTFNGIGAATVTITDYNYCTPTTINVTITDITKFTAKEALTFTHEVEGDTITKTLGDIFTAVEGKEINDEGIVVSYVDDTTQSVQIVENDSASSWEDKYTLTFTGTGTVTITITDNNNCNTATATVTIVEPKPVDKFDLVFENTDKYLYRVGNDETTPVKLGSLFKAIDGAEIGNVEVTVEKINEATSVSGTYTPNASDWTQGTIKFDKTGPVKVTIDDNAYANEKTLYLEVVDGKNVTAYSELTNANSVLLNDITMISGGTYYLSNATLYGNGFTFDVTSGKTGNTSSGSVSNNYVICLASANIDNIKIIGKVYESYGGTVKDDYNFPTILATGDSVIANSYVSNCSSPVRFRGTTLNIIESTLSGGNFANIDIREGKLILEDVTTINQSSSNDKATDGSSVVGLGIVIYYENVPETTSIEIKGTLTQYNHISDKDEFKSEYAQQLVNTMLGSDYTALQLESNGETWVNSGIVSMTEGMSDNIKDCRTDTDSYIGKASTFYGITGYVYTKVPTENSIKENVPEYSPNKQGAIAPSSDFDNTINDLPINDNDYCYKDSNGIIQISMDAGDEPFEWDPNILTVTKFNNELDYTYEISPDVTIADGKMYFNTTGEYTVTYTYTDPYNYCINESNVESYPKNYTKNLKIVVAVIQPTSKHAEFTFGSSNNATEKITIGNNTYISAADVSDDNSTWSYITVDGQKIYYPIVEATIVDKKIAYFNVFKNIITITDYADGGTGAAVTYNSSTTTMPSGLTVVKGIYKAFADISSDWSTLNDTALTLSGASNVFKYAASASAAATPTTYSDALCFASPEVTNSRDEYITMVQYSYTDATNTTYYYYVGYHMAEKGDGSCISADTLITLADGTQKEVQYLTGNEELLVWNLETGSYDSAPIVFVDSDEEKAYEIIHLYFSDGTDVEVIYEHGFFDLNEKKYVYIDKNNAFDYIGHSFVKQSDVQNNTWNEVELESVVIENKVTTAYSPVTFEHLCYYTNNMLSMPGGIEGLFNIFDVDTASMSYIADKMAEDIEAYGLFTYSDFEDLISETAYYAFNGDILKVAIGKGMLTWEDIEYLAQRYMPLVPSEN